jgi:hypothetical protein
MGKAPRFGHVAVKGRITARELKSRGYAIGDVIDSESWRKPRKIVSIDPVAVVLRELPPDVDRRYVKSVPGDVHRVEVAS